MYKLIINLKAYEESFDVNARKIAEVVKNLDEFAHFRGVEIILCPEIIDFKEIVNMGVKCFSQHIDDVEFGAHTGSVVPEEILRVGGRGSLISHSEDFESIESIEKKVLFCKQVGLESCVCVRDIETLEKVYEFNPDFIAIEPKELIGGDVSVTSESPDLIKNAVEKAGVVNLLVGAGIKNSEDVREAVKLGAKGILVASGVVKAKNVEEALRDLIIGFE
jgi:triosephosphate isomerase